MFRVFRRPGRLGLRVGQPEVNDLATGTAGTAECPARGTVTLPVAASESLHVAPA